MSTAGPVPPAVELVGIRKAFGDLVANDDVSLTVRAGEVHALLGENGAGKSTLMRVLYGLTRPDAGQVLVDGVPVRISSPSDAIGAGIGMVTQEFSLVGPMTVTENLLLASAGLGRLDLAGARRRVEAAAERLGVVIDPDATVSELSMGERQRVEILKALDHDCRVLILDEPTAVLTPQDSSALFAAVRRLTAEGMGVLLISHKLHEVTEAASRVSVLRRGRLTASVELRPGHAVQPRELAALMVGATGEARAVGAGEADAVAIDAAAVGLVVEDAPAPAPAVSALAAPAVLEVRGLRVDGDARALLDIAHLSVRPGEVVGVAGVSGNGQAELVQALCGMRPVSAGQVLVCGTDVTGADPARRFRAGLGRLTEDRRGSVVGAMSVEQNLVLEDLASFRRGPFVDRARVRRHALRLIEEYGIKAAPTDPVRSLSGGNMQKVLLARALARDPRAVVVSQPTRGLDVGACAYVHARLLDRRAAGAGILLVSEDLDELIALSDRIVVLYAGCILGELAAADVTLERLGLLMAGEAGAVAA
ncbi:sugar ABC transporter ATP-binding protein [Actinomycetota bacterium]|nr:sugar ABC transporter ATP-binding protein [Actinomycetota bacterium]